jgi:hypothetical protein
MGKSEEQAGSDAGWRVLLQQMIRRDRKQKMRSAIWHFSTVLFVLATVFSQRPG